MNPWKFIKPFAVMKIISLQCTWQKRLSIIQRCGMIHFDISHLVFGIERMDPSFVIRAQVSGDVCVCVCVSGRVSRKFIMRIKKASLIWLQAKLTLERRCVCVRERGVGGGILLIPSCMMGHMYSTNYCVSIPHKNVYHGITMALVMFLLFFISLYLILYFILWYLESCLCTMVFTWYSKVLPRIAWFSNVQCPKNTFVLFASLYRGKIMVIF